MELRFEVWACSFIMVYKVLLCDRQEKNTQENNELNPFFSRALHNTQADGFTSHPKDEAIMVKCLA